jgi:hypothetical protein
MQIPTAEELEKHLREAGFSMASIPAESIIGIDFDASNDLWNDLRPYAIWRPLCGTIYQLVAQAQDNMSARVLHEHVVCFLLKVGISIGREQAERDPLVKLFRREGP